VETDMMISDKERGVAALSLIDKMVAPQPAFIGGRAKALYTAEAKRAEYIKRCATAWAKVAGVDQEQFWTRSVPQALHDAFETASAIVAAEAFLKRFGWKVERPTQ
jgi:hypothetical protein